MTDREKAIVMAHTGICMLEGEKLGVFYQYLDELYGRPVYTHEWLTLDIKEKSKPDFLKLCKEEETERRGTCAGIDRGCIYQQKTMPFAVKGSGKMAKCNVVDIARNEPHKVSEVICVKCGRRWVAVRPETTLLKHLECPQCKSTGFVIETGEKIDG